MDLAPLVVTLRCGGPGWQYCEVLRKRHFPPARNVVPTHIALFHQLPGEQITGIEAETRQTSMAQGAFQIQVTGVRSLGRGVALAIQSDRLLRVHQKLSASWDRWLIPQDRKRLSPHITIQNKVTPDQARSLKAELETNFVPFSVNALGLDIWSYRNGPWEHAAFAAFSDPPPASAV